MTMDKRALKILFDTHWTPAGWTRERRQVSAEDFAYAKAHKVMFDPTTLGHDDTIQRLRAVVGRLSRQQVVDGFLSSLSTRRLEWRSALGTYSVAQHLPMHPEARAEKRCPVCGMYSGEHEHDLSVLNFERFKWGGVRHSQPVYALLDLELFLASPPPPPTAEDMHLFRALVASIEAVPAKVTGAALQAHLTKELKSSRAERDRVVAILGLCGVLDSPDHPGFAEHFVPDSQRALPPHRFVDMEYPACWWRGDLGLNRSRLREQFGHAL
jgi:hypothetical protein